MAWLKYDESVFLWINGLGGHSSVIDNIFSAIANDYFVIILSCMILILLWTGTRNPDKRRHIQKGIMVATSSLGISQLAVNFINDIWVRPPFETLDGNLLFYAPTDPSFPSTLLQCFALAGNIYI